MAIESINPATGEVLKTFEPLTDQELATKLDLAAEAFAAHGIPASLTEPRGCLRLRRYSNRRKKKLAAS